MLCITSSFELPQEAVIPVNVNQLTLNFRIARDSGTIRTNHSASFCRLCESVWGCRKRGRRLTVASSRQ
jgi:hypothetical protein